MCNCTLFDIWRLLLAAISQQLVSNMLFDSNLHFFPISIVINFTGDWAEPNEFASMTTACLLLLYLLNVASILFAYCFIWYLFHRKPLHTSAFQEVS